MSATNMGTYVPERLCRIPENCEAAQLKYCEWCGKPFTRKYAPTQVQQVRNYRLYSCAGNSAEHAAQVRRDTGDKFCKACNMALHTPSIEVIAHRTLKLRIEQESYREMLPTEAEQRHAHHLPHFDSSVSPVHKPARKRQSVPPGWEPLVVALFDAKGEATMEEICEVIPGCYTPMQAYSLLYTHSFVLKTLRFERIPGMRGRGNGVYQLVSHEKETVH